jgi:putative thioredoxin
MSAGPWIVDVGEATFDREVLARSAELPVVVDFWAPWCGPCRMLGPVLERLAGAGAGAWLLAKLNTDENPRLAMAYGIQGIPAVKAFRDGRVVDEFVGALPEPAVRDWLSRLVPPPASPKLANAERLEAAGDLAGAEAAYRAALAEAPDDVAARLGLGRVLVGQDCHEDAIQVLEALPPEQRAGAEAERWLALARFRQSAALTGGEIAARHRLAADPDDLGARLALAEAQAAKGHYREALEGYLAVLDRDRGEAREQARQAILAIFGILGDEDEVTRTYRPRLAAAMW